MSWDCKYFFSLCLPFHLSCGFHFCFTHTFFILVLLLKIFLHSTSEHGMQGHSGSGSFCLSPAIHPTKIHALDSSNDLQLHECEKLSDTNRNASARMHFLPQQPGNFQAPRIQLQQPLQGSVTEGSMHGSGVRVPDSSLSSAIYQLHLPADRN